MVAKNNLKARMKDFGILIEPVITESSTRAAELNKYVFKVVSHAEKGEIKKAVEAIFGVKVTAVNTINVPRKKRIRGRRIGFRSGVRKALVTLKAGDTIEFFKNK